MSEKPILTQAHPLQMLTLLRPVLRYRNIHSYVSDVLFCGVFINVFIKLNVDSFTDLFQVFGPIGGVLSNSRCYSAIRPDIQKAYTAGFTCSHVTIQMPVYKESLRSVIMPTVTSLKAAISHYELNGGTANIFVFDDGLQLLPEDEAQARKDFYTDNNIGWVSRPKHGVDGFIRGGKFKKASNMNYGLNISNKTEDVLQSMIAEKIRADGTTNVTESEEDELYHAALEKVLKDDGRAWADGNIRVGEYILIVDSDTRVVSQVTASSLQINAQPHLLTMFHSLRTA